MSEIADTLATNKSMGAIPNAKGVTFRVWAPHAEKVYLTGTFNGWSGTSTPLFNEKNGYWSTNVPGAKTGDEYRYVIHAPTDWNLPPLSRIDPYARITGMNEKFRMLDLFSGIVSPVIIGSQGYQSYS